MLNNMGWGGGGGGGCGLLKVGGSHIQRSMAQIVIHPQEIYQSVIVRLFFLTEVRNKCPKVINPVGHFGREIQNCSFTSVFCRCVSGLAQISS